MRDDGRTYGDGRKEGREGVYQKGERGDEHLTFTTWMIKQLEQGGGKRKALRPWRYHGERAK